MEPEMQTTEHEPKEQPQFRQMVRNFMIEIVVYSVLMAIYFFIALRFWGEPLAELFKQNLVVYAVAGLALIVVQAVVLEFVTSFLFDFLGLHRLTSGTPKH